MAKQPKVLTGQVAAITGAARGIGKATAEAFIRQGMKVAIGDLDLAEAQKAADQLGAGTIALELNVTEKDSIERFLDETEKQLGPVDVLVNNAGIMQLGRFWEEDDATAQRMVDINLHGVICGTKSALRRMIPRNRGAIVNIASQAGLYGAPGGATYSATKHGVVGLSEAIRGELRLAGHDDIQVSYVCPVVVNTELGRGTADTQGREDGPAAGRRRRHRRGAPARHRRRPRPEVGQAHRRRSPRCCRAAASEGIARAMKADRVLFEADPNARRGYELRAAQSEPGLEPADETEAAHGVGVTPLGEPPMYPGGGAHSVAAHALAPLPRGRSPPRSDRTRPRAGLRARREEDRLALRRHRPRRDDPCSGTSTRRRTWATPPSPATACRTPRARRRSSSAAAARRA